MRTTTDLRQRWEERYRSGPRPWDTGITPPEVKAFWAKERLPPTGLALDLGCGPATNVAFLAEQGLQVLGFDIAFGALQVGMRRLRQKHPALLPRLQLIQADVTRLPLTHARASYILDIGCLHTIPSPLRNDYAKGIVGNLRPGGYYQLYAFDRDPEENNAADARGVGDHEVETLFTPDLQVVHIQRANPDRYPCRWYLLQRR